MKVVKLLFLFFLPFVLHGQTGNAISDSVLRLDLLFKMGRHTVVIKPMQVNNEAHQWTTFDSVTNITVTKRLVTPYVKRIVRQHYFSTGQSIIRIDQYFVAKRLHISAYVFDVYGNIIFRKSITDSIASANKVLPSLYYVVQSQDKQIISLVQAMVFKGERVKVSSVVINNQLQITGDQNYMLPFDSELLDMYLPLVNNDGTVLIFVADKPQSYKLGSALTCYLLAEDAKTTKSVQFEFERKKVNGLNFTLTGDSLLFTALFSLESRKKDIVGHLKSGFEMSTYNKMPVTETLYIDPKR